MPWRPIQTATAGWLSLLGLKNLGRNPDEVLEQVRPTTDMDGWWLRGEAQSSTESLVMAVANQVLYPTFLRVPDNEWCYIHSLAAESFSGGGGANRLYAFAAVQIPGGVHTIWISQIVPSVSMAGAGVAQVAVRDLWLPPGCWFGALCDGAIGDTIRVGALFTRLRV